MNKSSERGEAKLGCIFLLLVIAVLVFLVFKIGPMYVDKVNFEDDLNSITNKAGVYAWSERMIAKEIVTAAEAYGFQTSSEEIEINRLTKYQQAPRIVINVQFSKSIGFPGYTHLFKFEASSTGLIGRL